LPQFPWGMGIRAFHNQAVILATCPTRASNQYVYHNKE
jgi:hypothetical protein